jgi:hypothetical protein
MVVAEEKRGRKVEGKGEQERGEREKGDDKLRFENGRWQP